VLGAAAAERSGLAALAALAAIAPLKGDIAGLR
jgi:hypothetical protein